MAATPLTIAQIRTFPVGTPVPLIQGVLADVYERRTNIGRNKSSIQSAMLQDAAGDKIRLNIWNHVDYTARKGTPITVVAVTEKGKCSTRSIENSYHNPPTIELEVSKGSQILFSGDQNQSAPPDHSEPTEDEAPGRGGSAPRSQPVQRPISGQNVGMCIKEAVGIVMRVEGADSIDYVKSSHFSHDVWMIASDLIRISRTLEDGKLAPRVKDRENPPPTQPPPPVMPPTAPSTPLPLPPAPAAQGKPRPGPDGSAYDPEHPGIEEDIPF